MAVVSPWHCYPCPSPIVEVVGPGRAIKVTLVSCSLQLYTLLPQLGRSWLYRHEVIVTATTCKAPTVFAASNMMKDGTGDQQGKEEIKMKVRNSGEDAQQDGKQEAPVGGPAKGTSGVAQGKYPNLVAYILLGLFILLTVLFVVGMLKFKQISSEIKDLKDDVTMQLAKMKHELSTEIRNGHAQLLRGQTQIDNKLVMLSGDVGSAHTELKSGQVQMTNDIARLTDQTRRSHSGISTQLAEMKENCQPRFECPDQWTLFRQKCYYFSPNVEDWTSSQRFCSSKMSNLAVIDTAEEQGFLKEEIKLTRYWIGLNESDTKGEWVWVDGTDYASTQTFWAPGEPKDIGSYEGCVGMKSDGKWNVHSCSQRFNFICERPVFCHFK
ncbi:asialoglycoprotein receptor 1-like [Heterodontus francisci]|uniref:asialoglycoprotein receptor 1-like n=1 Tax=Heterodontus francisci TaxID=7792 RepID=UPI00355ACF72